MDKELKVSCYGREVSRIIRCSHVSGTASRNTKRQVEQPLRLIKIKSVRRANEAASNIVKWLFVLFRYHE